MKAFLLLLLIVALAACGDGITLPLEGPNRPFLPATGTWRGEAGGVVLTMELVDVVSYDVVFGVRLRFVNLSGKGTYTIPATEASDTFSVRGHRSGADEADILLNLGWGLGQLRGSMIDHSTITGHLGGAYWGGGWETGSGTAVVLRKQ